MRSPTLAVRGTFMFGKFGSPSPTLREIEIGMRD
jgi:hypothetical protein